VQFLLTFIQHLFKSFIFLISQFAFIWFESTGTGISDSDIFLQFTFHNNYLEMNHFLYRWFMFLRGRLDEAETTLLRSDLLFFDNAILSYMQYS